MKKTILMVFMCLLLVGSVMAVTYMPNKQEYYDSLGFFDKVIFNINNKNVFGTQAVFQTIGDDDFQCSEQARGWIPDKKGFYEVTSAGCGVAKGTSCHLVEWQGVGQYVGSTKTYIIVHPEDLNKCVAKEGRICKIEVPVKIGHQYEVYKCNIPFESKCSAWYDKYNGQCGAYNPTEQSTCSMGEKVRCEECDGAERCICQPTSLCAPSCSNDAICNANQYCSNDGYCFDVVCPIGEIVNHKCVVDGVTPPVTDWSTIEPNFQVEIIGSPEKVASDESFEVKVKITNIGGTKQVELKGDIKEAGAMYVEVGMQPDKEIDRWNTANLQSVLNANAPSCQDDNTKTQLVQLKHGESEEVSYVIKASQKCSATISGWLTGNSVPTVTSEFDIFVQTYKFCAGDEGHPVASSDFARKNIDLEVKKTWVNSCEGCKNGYADGDETGPDCGGSTCEPCKLDAFCLIDDDCAEGLYCMPRDGKEYGLCKYSITIEGENGKRLSLTEEEWLKSSPVDIMSAMCTETSECSLREEFGVTCDFSDIIKQKNKDSYEKLTSKDSLYLRANYFVTSVADCDDLKFYNILKKAVCNAIDSGKDNWIDAFSGINFDITGTCRATKKGVSFDSLCILPELGGMSKCQSTGIVAGLLLLLLLLILNRK